ncbi:hypothetical protein HNP29_000443 [Pseudomonas alcaligenes]|nr:hypothetical protein [Pseudomonas alcaligenes]
MSDYSFRCVCGSTEFESEKPIDDFEDFIGSKCAKCHREVTEAEVQKQAADIAEQVLRDTLKGF